MKTTRQKVLEPKRELRRPHFDGYKLKYGLMPVVVPTDSQPRATTV